MAIFTFILVFLYPRYASNQLNGVLFQVTLATTLLTIFLFGFAGVYYFEAGGVAETTVERRKMLMHKGDTAFVLSLLLATTTPALILFTLDIPVVAIMATALWVLFASFIIRQGQKLRRP